MSLAEEVCEGLGLVDGETRVTCLVDVDPDLIVEADPEQLYRVLSNLARNAAQAINASGRQGRLTIAADEIEDRVEIRVIDTGPGLAGKGPRASVSNHFVAAHVPGGTGLGLAIANELIRANGGTLTLVASTTAGSEFCISLPRRAAAAAA